VIFMDSKRDTTRTDGAVQMQGKMGRRGRRRRTGRGLLAAAAALALGLTAAPAASANLLSAFETSSSSTQAGAYADSRINFEVADLANGPVKQVRFHLPVGLLGTISNFPTCDLPDFYEVMPTCPEETQVGVADVGLNVNTPQDPFVFPIPFKVNVLKAGRGDTALLGLSTDGLTARALIRLNVRPDDYGLDAEIEALPNNVGGTDMTLWGVPWDNWSAATRARTTRLPFMANPATCGKELETTVEVQGYADQGTWETHRAATPPQTGCDRLEFRPEIWTSLDTPFKSSPSGFTFGIDVPQNNDPDQLATAPIKDVTAVLPEGVSINPSVANGLEACTDAQLGQGSNERSTCPTASRVGTAEFRVPALLDPEVNGTVYIGEPLPGNTYRLFVEAYGSSMRVKLKGTVRPDPVTGRLTVTFENNPEAPVESIKLSFRGGPRAALAMPDTCGRKPVAATLASWAGDASSRLTVQRSTAFDVTFDANGTPCPPQGFAPSFAAGVTNAAAGASSPFALHVRKPDGQADLNRVALRMPKGLLANLKGNLGTRIGTAEVAAGVGTSPYWLSGPVVLEGPYGDAPFSLRVTVPVIAGPFNLGNVVVRQKLYVDPNDASVTVDSDPLPTIWEGIPVRLQELRVKIDKAGFMVNPTSCEVQQVNGTLAAAQGQIAEVGSRFQAGGCADLKYAPRLEMRLRGNQRELRDGGHPRLDAKLTTKQGEANQRRVQVTLPLNLALDPDNAKALCEPSAIPNCPQDSIVGKAKAVSVLDVPLEGPVYFVRGERTTGQGRVVPTLPKLFVPLKGQGVTFNLHADSNVVDNKLQTTFTNLPDAPIESFELQINGGSNGVLRVTNGAICRSTSTPTVDQRLIGQNGRVHRASSSLGTNCRTSIVRTSRSGASRVNATVGGLGGEQVRVTVTGKGLARASRRISARSTVATVKPRLSLATRRALAAGREVRVTMTATVTPTAKGGKAKKATRRIVLKPTAAERARARR
jgi:hypothetical protein